MSNLKVDQIQIEQIIKEMGENLKKEILQLLKDSQNIQEKQSNKDKKLEDKKKEVKPVSRSIGENPVEDMSSLKIDQKNEPVIIDAQSLLKEEMERKEKEDRELAAKKRRELKQKSDENITLKKYKENEMKIKTVENRQKDDKNIPDVVKNFKSTKVSRMKPKKMWIPIANR